MNAAPVRVRQRCIDQITDVSIDELIDGNSTNYLWKELSIPTASTTKSLIRSTRLSELTGRNIRNSSFWLDIYRVNEFIDDPHLVCDPFGTPSSRPWRRPLAQ
jgi:hypothetical protein